MATARAVRSDGSESQIAAEDIASSEPMQALSTLERALRGGRGAADALCRTIAGRVAEDPGVEFVELRWERFAVLGFFRGEREPLASRRVARCAVDRGADRPAGGSP